MPSKQADGRGELAVREQSVQAMQRAVADLNHRLDAMRTASEGLAVRAPVGGRVTGLTLQVGESVRAGTRIARLDSLGRFSWSCGSTNSTSAAFAKASRRAQHEGREHGSASPASTPRSGTAASASSCCSTDPPPLQVGQGLDVRLTWASPSPRCCCPIAASTPTPAAPGLCAMPMPTAAAPRAARCNSGRRADGVIEVLGGLQPGEQVVVSRIRA